MVATTLRTLEVIGMSLTQRQAAMGTPESVELSLDAFPGASVVGTGDQAALIVACLGEPRPDLVWWVSDCRFVGSSSLPRTGAEPRLVGTTEQLLALLPEVEQFDSGVFLGVESGVPTPRCREGGVWTEDPEGADLGDAVVEVRVFDYTWFEVMSDASLVGRIRVRFVGGIL